MAGKHFADGEKKNTKSKSNKKKNTKKETQNVVFETEEEALSKLKAKKERNDNVDLSEEKKKAEKRAKKEAKKLRKQEKKKGKVRTFFRWFFRLLFLAILIAAGIFGYKVYLNGGGLSGILKTAMGHDQYTLKNMKPIRILIMGASDANQGTNDEPYYLTDTIMIMQYNPKTQEAPLMSVPRDTYVGKTSPSSASTSTLQSYKINSVFFNYENIEGESGAVSRISAATGISLDNYLIIDTKALVKIVDLIGGVDFNVPIDMDYDDETHGLSIHLKAGMQHLNGAQAEQVLRFRHNNDDSTYDTTYGDNDSGRMRTQRVFIAAVLKQTVTWESVFKIQDMLGIVKEDVTTNMDLDYLKDYVPYMIDFDIENLKTGVLPVTNKYINKVWIAVINEGEAKEVVSYLFPDDELKETDENGEVVEENKEEVQEEEIDISTITVSITNSSGVEANGEKVKAKLEAEGFVVKNVTSGKLTTNTTIINRTKQKSEISIRVKNSVGMGTIQIGENNGSADYTVIIGSDYVEPEE